MDLLIDIGNTNLKWVPRTSGRVGEMRTVRYQGALPIDLHAAWEQIPAPGRVLVSNVGGREIADALTRACRSHWSRMPEFALTQSRGYGVTIAYEHPERLGVDRWLALIAARHLHRGPLLILDAGSAITYDLLLADGTHLGGLILPGIEMMRDSLLAHTHIPRIEPEEIDAHWAADTGSGVAAGSLQAPAALAERLQERLATQAGARPEIIVTGGDAERLVPLIHRPVRHQPDLVLQGLALLHA